jgi:hypothetical protein
MVIISRKAIALGSTITLVLVAAAHGHNAFAPAAPHPLLRPVAANVPSISRDAFDARFSGERTAPKVQDRLGEPLCRAPFPAGPVAVARAAKGDRLDRASAAVALR